MADVTWIKLATEFPGDRKIKQIRRMPEGDTIALMWIFLLCLAGDINDDGMIYLTPEIPFSDEELADEFKMDVGIVRVALQTFQKLGMIDIVDDVICLTSWEKWQATDKLAELRDYNKIKQRESRARKKLLKGVNDNVNDMSLTCQPCQDTDIDIDIDKDLEKESDNKNILSNSNHSKSKKTSPTKHKYGEYNNVLLTDDELQKLKTEFPDYAERIENLSEYIESTGKVYKSHYVTIKSWAKREAKKQQGRKELVPDWMDKPKKNFFQDYDSSTEGMSDLERKILNDRVQKLKQELGTA